MMENFVGRMIMIDIFKINEHKFSNSLELWAITKFRFFIFFF